MVRTSFSIFAIILALSSAARAETCDPSPPYSIQTASAAATAKATLVGKAAGVLAKASAILPGVGAANVAAGGQGVANTDAPSAGITLTLERKAYAGMIQQAIADVAHWMQCKQMAYVDASSTLSATQKSSAKDQIDSATSNLNAKLSAIFNPDASASDLKTLLQADNVYTRQATDADYDPAIFDGAFGNVSAQTTFRTHSDWTLLVTAIVPNVANASGCVAIANDVLEQSQGPFQAALVGFWQGYRAFIDGGRSLGPRMMYQALWMAKTAQITAPSPNSTNAALSQCQALDAQLNGTTTSTQAAVTTSNQKATNAAPGTAKAPQSTQPQPTQGGARH